jgi:hypothetical protein
VTDKRCYSTAEAMNYLGIKRRSFEKHILSRLEGKGVRIGTCLVYEVRDLDAAWDDYKASVSTDPGPSAPRPPAPHPSSSRAFDEAAERVIRRQAKKR